MADQGGPVEREVVVLAAAELLCKTFVRHKPRRRDHGFVACDRCVGQLATWDDWLVRGEALATKRGVLG